MTTQTTSKKITIDVLAQMVNNGFKEVRKDLLEVKTELNQRIDGLEGRFDGLEKNMDFRFNGVQGQLDSIYLNYTRLDHHHALENRIKKVEKKPIDKMIR